MTVLTPVPRAFRGGSDTLKAQLTAARIAFTGRLPVFEADPDKHAYVLSEHYCYLSLFDLWEGRTEDARKYLDKAGRITLHYVAHYRTIWGSVTAVADNTRRVVQGAIAASLAGNTELSRTLFEEAALIGAGITQADQDLTPAACEFIHDSTAENPLHHAYSLIRLGRLKGFKTAVYTKPWPEAKSIKPVWMETDVRTVLHTAQVVMAASRSTKTHVFMPEAELSILLDMLITCLERPDDKAANAAAQKRLGIFYNRISNLGELEDIYPLVLDLQEAFPHIFKPVVPNPLRTA